MQVTQPKTQIFNCIDLLKFICAILVIIIHIKPFGNVVSKSISDCLNFGLQNYLARIAVPFFFVSSGFFLYKKSSIKDFDITYSIQYIKKLFRLYFTWTIIYLPLIIRDLLKDEQGINHAILIFFRNSIFTGSFVHLWFIPALIFAVVLVSFLLKRKINPKTIITISLLFYITSLFAQSWFGFIKPLEFQLPTFWSSLKFIQRIIETTRDGLFEGFFFVSLGMCFAFYNFNFNKNKASIGFIISMFFLLIETLSLHHFGYVRAYDLYLFLVPSVIFMFYISLNINLTNRLIYKTLRILSTLIFLSHLLINAIVYEILKIIYEPFTESWVQFLLTLMLSIIMSYTIIRISEYKRFIWLKYLYS